MAEASSLNDVIIANVANLNDIAIANIASINTIDIPSAEPDTLSVNISTIEFDSDGIPLSTPAIGITSNTTWTCEWDTGTYFDADIYGGTGNDVVTVSCLGTNELPQNLTDTLRFFIGASEYASVDVTQYEFGV